MKKITQPKPRELPDLWRIAFDDLGGSEDTSLKPVARRLRLDGAGSRLIHFLDSVALDFDAYEKVLSASAVEGIFFLSQARIAPPNLPPLSAP